MFGFTAAAKKRARPRIDSGFSLCTKTSSLNIGDFEQRIKEHEAGVQKNPRDRVCYRTVCAGCDKKAPFAPHGLRKRTLRYIVRNSVVCNVIWLARWRCRRCGRTFTDHPDFRSAL